MITDSNSKRDTGGGATDDVAEKSSRIATAGVVLVAAACGLALLYATTLAGALLTATVWVGAIGLMTCVIGVIICLGTGKPGAGRATIAVLSIVCPLFLMSQT